MVYTLSVLKRKITSLLIHVRIVLIVECGDRSYDYFYLMTSPLGPLISIKECLISEIKYGENTENMGKVQSVILSS